MGRHRKKVKTKNNSETHQVDQNDLETHDVDPLPMDLVVEILERLPVKSLARSMCVSKPWETIIRSKEFIRSFSLRSSLSYPSRLLLVSKKPDYRNGRHDWYFCSSDDVTFHTKFHTKFQVVDKPHTEVHQCYVHGLMSFMHGECHFIINPSTGKSVTLPNVISRRNVLKRFFGYDPIVGEYKVLVIVKANYGSGSRLAPNEDQILTVESSSSSLSQWRKLKCKSVPHTPICDGVCIDGVVFYFAEVGNNVLTLVKFDVKSEELSFVTTSFRLEDLQLPNFYLICYDGYVAIANPIAWDTFDLWVWKDAVKDEWSKICLTAPTWGNMVTLHYPFHILGTNQMGEVVYTQRDLYGRLDVTYHDPKKKTQRKLEFQGNGYVDYDHLYNLFAPPPCFMDYVETAMLL